MIKIQKNGTVYNIKAVAIGNRKLSKLIIGGRNYLDNEGISCFSSGVWRGELPWLGNETWKS